MTLSPAARSPLADLLQLMAAWLVVVLLVQGLQGAMALGAGPRHSHGAAGAAHAHGHHHDGAQRHHHDGAQRHHHDGAQRHHHDGAQRHHHDGAQRHHHPRTDSTVQWERADPALDAALDAAAQALALAMALMAFALRRPGLAMARHLLRAALPWFWRSVVAPPRRRPPRAS